MMSTKRAACLLALLLLSWLAPLAPAAAPAPAPAPAVTEKHPDKGILGEWMDMDSTDNGFERDMSMLIGAIYGDNSDRKFWWMLGTLFVGIALTTTAAKLVRWILDVVAMRHAQKTKSELDIKLLAAAGKPAALFVYGLGFYLSAFPLLVTMLGETGTRLCGKLALTVMACAGAIFLYRGADIFNDLLIKVSGKSGSAWDDLLISILGKALRSTIVLLSALLIGQNILGLNLTALLAGAGVVALGISFAARDTIANFFGCVMITITRPFRIGDRIVVEGVDGAVECVGIWNTRVRTLDGHFVTIPNEKISNTIVTNISMRPFLKLDTNLTVTYDTSPEKLCEAMAIVGAILANHEGLNPERPPRVAFTAFNDWSLNLKVVAFYHNPDSLAAAPDYWRFLDWQTKVNLEILTRFAAAGIEFAYPTSTVILAKDMAVPLASTPKPD